ncbi:hypothetical protein DFJ73DRAFT_868706 [Zopfochytrium polystomum]|nr:hypothetical protein DFJ73DRAFT_868706 [Zopfochytrium polystomum]
MPSDNSSAGKAAPAAASVRRTRVLPGSFASSSPRKTRGRVAVAVEADPDEDAAATATVDRDPEPSRSRAAYAAAQKSKRSPRKTVARKSKSVKQPRPPAESDHIVDGRRAYVLPKGFWLSDSELVHEAEAVLRPKRLEAYREVLQARSDDTTAPPHDRRRRQTETFWRNVESWGSGNKPVSDGLPPRSSRDSAAIRPMVETIDSWFAESCDSAAAAGAPNPSTAEAPSSVEEEATQVSRPSLPGEGGQVGKPLRSSSPDLLSLVLCGDAVEEVAPDSVVSVQRSTRRGVALPTAVASVRMTEDQFLDTLF